MTNSPVSIEEVANALAVSKRSAERRALRERWAYTEVPVRGGRKRLYQIASLPEPVRTQILLRQAPAIAGFTSSSSAAETAAFPPGASPGAPGGLFIPQTAAPARAADQPRPLNAERRQYDREALWAWYEPRPASIRGEGQRRAQICLRVRALIDAGVRARRAIHEAARVSGIAEATLRRWWYGEGRIIGAAHVDPSDYAAALAPRYAGCPELAEISPEAWDWIKADWLRPEQPALYASYRRLLRVAAERGWQVPSYATVARRIEALPWQVIVLAREGEEALKRRLPHVTRLRGHLHALQAVCADGHTFDLRVKLPSGAVGRPVMVAWQDIYSGKILSWRCGETLSSHLVRLAFGELVERYGVPEHAYLDNGREFASKWLTGGAPTRFRFAIRDEDPIGTFTAMGIAVHWTTPYHGQAKPIERAFRDLCETIARHPAASGAYTGNSPLNKPENYGQRALKWAEFIALVDEGIREHNARTGRRTETARGRSFDQTFDESYANSVIRQPTAEQRRLWLLAAEGVTVRETGHVAITGNLYWGEEVAALAGRRVVVRFDPDRLDSPVHVYTLDGVYVGEAARTTARFDDIEAAREHARANRQRLRAARAQLEAERRLRAIEVARTLPATPGGETPPPAAVELMPERRRRKTATAVDDAAAHVSKQERTVLALLDEWAREKRIVGGD